MNIIYYLSNVKLFWGVLFYENDKKITPYEVSFFLFAEAQNFDFEQIIRSSESGTIIRIFLFVVTGIQEQVQM